LTKFRKSRFKWLRKLKGAIRVKVRRPVAAKPLAKSQQRLLSPAAKRVQYPVKVLVIINYPRSVLLGSNPERRKSFSCCSL
jgi:hypothetical protein